MAIADSREAIEQRLLPLLTGNDTPPAEMLDLVAALRARSAVTTDPALFAVVLAVECRAHFRLSSQEAAQQACGQALQLAKRSADNTALVAAHRMNGILTVEGGHPAESVPDFLAALAAAERLGDGRSIAMALGNLGAAA